MRRRFISAVLLGIVVTAATPSGQPTNPDTQNLLDRVGRYVDDLERHLSVVIADEQYEQRVMTDQVLADGLLHAVPMNPRHMSSDVSFMWVPEESIWLTVRSVRSVDRKPITDSEHRLERALANHGPDRTERLRQLRDDGARFNLGHVGRNFSDPLFGLQVADPRVQPRMSWSISGQERLQGLSTWRLTFVEQSHPTIIQRAPDKKDLLSRGDIWITADGTVHQTRIVVDDPQFDTHALVVVFFALDKKLGRWLPTRMDETYTQQPTTTAPAGPFREQIDCVARYSNYRQFETSAHLLSQ